MNHKKLCCLMIMLMGYGYINAAADISRPFRARNQAADVYGWAKESAREKVRGLIACGCALGAFNYFRSGKHAGKLMAFMEAAGVGTTVYTLLGFLRKFALNPLIRWLPSVASKRRVKSQETRALLDSLQELDIKTEDRLPSEEHIRTKTDSKMMERLRKAIGYGGLNVETNWVEELKITEKPDYVGPVPVQAQRLISYIRNPERYSRHGAQFDRGLLLYGQPGCGKTTLAQLIAYETGCPFIQRSCSSMHNQFIGVGPNALRAVFDTASSAANVEHKKAVQAALERERPAFFKALKDCAKKLSLRPLKHCVIGYIRQLLGRSVASRIQFIRPAIVCMDEIDAVTTKRGSGAHAEDRRMIEQLFQSLDSTPHVVVIGTTNEGGEFHDEGVVRPGRLGAPVPIPLPEEDHRFEIIKCHMSKWPHIPAGIALPDQGEGQKFSGLEASDRKVYWQSILQRTEGFTGAELRDLVNKAALTAGDEDTGEVTKQHFEQAFEETLAGFSESRKKQIDDWKKQLKQRAAAVPIEVMASTPGSSTYTPDVDELGEFASSEF